MSCLRQRSTIDLLPSAISVIATTSEKQDNHNDNQDRCHSFLQIYNGRFSLSHVGLKSLRHQPRNLPSAAGATVSLDRPAPAMANPAGKYAGVSMPPPDATQHGAGRKTDPNADPDALPVLAARIARYRALCDRRTRGCPAGSDRADHRPPTTIRAARSGCTCLVSDSSEPVTIAPIGRPCRKFTLSACRQTRPLAKELALSAAIGVLFAPVRGDLAVDIGACQIDDLTAWRRSTHLLQPIG